MMATSAKEQRSIGVFFGHQFVSETQSQTEIRRVVSESVKLANSDWNKSNIIKIKAKYKPLRMDSDSNVFQNVLDAIDVSDICIFDLTDKNYNVLFELGHANGRKKEIIWICNEDIPLASLPSDFQGKFILRYEDENDLGPLLESEIKSRINAILRGYTEDRAFREVWSFGQSTTVNLVFGRIPENLISKFGRAGDPNYLRYQSMADIDTLVQLSRFLSRNFPHIVQHDYTASDFIEMDSPLIAVGGPDWNSIARRYYGTNSSSISARLPIVFKTDEHSGEDYLVLGSDSQELRTTENVSGEVEDIGIFAKFEDKRYNVPVYAISGIRTGGVLGSALVFSDNKNGRRNCQYLSSIDKDLSEFVIIFRVLCTTSGGEVKVETPILNDKTIILLDTLN